MILTDKTLKDFTFWLYNEHAMKIFNIEFMKPLLFNTLIIEFFDSVGIIINITYSMGVFNYNILGKYPFYRADLFKTRQEATEEAIEKANEIYNETKE